VIPESCVEQKKKKKKKKPGGNSGYQDLALDLRGRFGCSPFWSIEATAAVSKYDKSVVQSMATRLRLHGP
jgi:hypothetical protein